MWQEMHAQRRARERYGVNLQSWQLNAIKKRCTAETFYATATNGGLIYRVRTKWGVVYPLLREDSEYIVTFLSRRQAGHHKNPKHSRKYLKDNAEDSTRISAKISHDERERRRRLAGRSRRRSHRR